MIAPINVYYYLRRYLASEGDYISKKMARKIVSIYSDLICCIDFNYLIQEW